MATWTNVTNLTKETKKHQLSIGTYAFRTREEMKGGMGRQSPVLTELSCAGGSEVVRKKSEDFKSGWFALPSVDRYAAINTQYFTQALIPEGTKELPRCELLAEEAYPAGKPRDADHAVYTYHAKLMYPGKELAPGATVPERTERRVSTIALPSAGRLREKLREHFGFRRFRPGQLEAVRSALSGNDTLVLMPTGSGSCEPARSRTWLVWPWRTTPPCLRISATSPAPTRTPRGAVTAIRSPSAASTAT